MARTFRLAMALAVAGAASPAAAECAMAPADREWLENALQVWRKAEPELLALDSRPLPMIAAIDGECLYLMPEGSFEGVNATPHAGSIMLPDGAEVAIGPVSFASGEGSYFAMSLPSVWRAAGVNSELGLERLMTGVLLHEMMHVRQTALATQAVGNAAAEAGVPDEELTDDIVQHRFSADPAYVAAYEAERDALFAAAAAPDDAQARKLAAEALDLMRTRRHRWFTGDKAAFEVLDDVFLTMEGMGQWLIYRHFLAQDCDKPSSGEALRETRRGGRKWSQDEGLALMLVVDRLHPNWQKRAFSDPDWRAARLLAAAVDDQSR